MKRSIMHAVVFILVMLAILSAVLIWQERQDASETEPETVAIESYVVPSVEISEDIVEIEPNQTVIDRYASLEIYKEDVDQMAAIIYLEARGESAIGQQAVAEVILNRVLSDGFPDTVDGVIHEDEDSSVPQFSTAKYILQARPTEEQYAAIEAAMYGPSVLPVDVVYFGRTAENDRVWGQIGGHIFCYEYIWS